MGKRGRLKIVWPPAVQVRILPRAPQMAPVTWGIVDRSIAQMSGIRWLGKPFFDHVADFLVREQFFEGVAVE